MKKTTVYSQSITFDNSIMTSGQLALNDDGAIVGDEIKAQTRQCLKNVKQLLSNSGYKLENIINMTVFLQDIKRDFLNFNETYVEFFGNCKPCRTTVGATLYKEEWLIEVQVTAHKDVDNRL